MTIDPVTVSTALLWRWRCEEDGAVFPGSDLCTSLDDVLIPLGECPGAEVERYTLCHKCGSGHVIPVAPQRGAHCCRGDGQAASKICPKH